MIVKCNACSMRYYLDDDVLGSKGGYVRCSSCKHVWYQNPPALSPYTPIPVVQAPLMMHPKLAHRSQPIRFFWIGFTILIPLCLGCTLFMLYQKNLLLSSLQGWSGLLKTKESYEEEKIQIQNVVYRYTENSIICKVDFINVTKELRYIPALFIHIQKEGKTLKKMKYVPPKTPLLPGEEKALYIELKQAPTSFSKISVGFFP
ncbi:MJ0042-type zinc finger domain-containing protein [Holospora undulata]|uniref:Family finger-like domain protein n=1 Tax=Holospora undulata HU1 TaxID=1321371 RepID=A0A061JIK2_9PROT|nr:MJ0042-type zinc finger domain-containing protein [Holospora undulata]ETZ04904.1 family finger-like domain protein [Holospora undulata HU1]